MGNDWTIYLIGVITMIYNLVKTAKSGVFVAREEAEAAPLTKSYRAPSNSIWHSVIERKPILLLVLSLVVVGIGGFITLWVKNNVNEAYILSIKDLIDAKFNGQEKLFNERFDTIDYRLDRIERSMNGHLLREVPNAAN